MRLCGCWDIPAVRDSIEQCGIVRLARRCPLSRNNGGTELSRAEKNLISQLVLDNFLPSIQIFQINVANILQHAMDH